MSIHLDSPKSVLYGNFGLPSSGCPNCPTHHCQGFHCLGFHSQCCELGSEGLETLTHTHTKTNNPPPPNKNPPPQILEDLKVEFWSLRTDPSIGETGQEDLGDVGGKVPQ